MADPAARRPRSWPMVLAWSMPLITWALVSAIHGVGWGIIALTATWATVAIGGAIRPQTPQP